MTATEQDTLLISMLYSPETVAVECNGEWVSQSFLRENSKELQAQREWLLQQDTAKTMPADSFSMLFL